MSTARDFLAEVQQRADAATDCGYAIVGRDGFEEPCARHATSWRWYQDVEHEDCLMPACDLHENKGGVWMAQMHAALTAALDLAGGWMRSNDGHATPVERRRAKCGQAMEAAITDALTPKENDS